MIRRPQFFFAPDGDTATATAPRDFAEMAIETVRTDPDAPKTETLPPKQASVKEPAAKEPAQKDEPRKVPDELFGGKKTAEVTKTETAAAEVSEIDKITDLESPDKKVQASWKALKAKAKEQETRANEFATKAADLEKRIAEYDAKGKDSEKLQARLAELEKQNAESMELVRKVNVELTPEFQQHRTARKNAVDSIKSLVGDAGGDAGAMEAALLLKGSDQIKAVAEVIGDLPTYVQGIIGAEIKELGNIDKTVDGMRSNPEEYLAGRQREQQDRESKENETLARNAQLAYDHADKKMSGELEVLRSVDGLEWWNKQADAIKQNARAFYETNRNPEAAAEMCIRAQSMQVYRDLFLDQRAENTKATAKIAELEGELKKLYGTAPGLRGTQASTNSKGGGDFASRTIDTMQGR